MLYNICHHDYKHGISARPHYYRCSLTNTKGSHIIDNSSVDWTKNCHHTFWPKMSFVLNVPCSVTQNTIDLLITILNAHYFFMATSLEKGMHVAKGLQLFEQCRSPIHCLNLDI